MASTVTISVWWKGPGRTLPRFAMDGKRVSLAKLARLYNLPEYTLMARISRGLHPSQWLLPADELSRVTKREGRRVAQARSARGAGLPIRLWLERRRNGR